MELVTSLFFIAMATRSSTASWAVTAAFFRSSPEFRTRTFSLRRLQPATRSKLHSPSWRVGRCSASTTRHRHSHSRELPNRTPQHTGSSLKRSTPSSRAGHFLYRFSDPTSPRSPTPSSAQSLEPFFEAAGVPSTSAEDQDI